MALDEVLDALGDPTRRRILEQLRVGPAPVGTIASRLPVSRPAVSQHLRVLERCALVEHDVVGTRHVYRAAPEGLLALRRWLDEFWEVPLDRFVARAEQEARRQR